jgi:hypothetical protein
MDEEQEIKSNVHRPFFLSILCIAIFSYSILFILLFLTGILYNKWITKVLNDFLTVGEVHPSSILILSFVGMILYSLSFLGAFLIWKLKRKGFYFYLISSLLIISLPYLFNFGNVISTIVLLLLVVLILAHFRKLN